MEFLPEWAPGIHPMVVHFPIALLVAAVVTDGVALVVKVPSRARMLAAILFIAGSIMAIATYFSGRSAADGVLLPPGAELVLEQHEGWAEWTVIYFVLLSVAVAVRQWMIHRSRRLLDFVLLAFGLAGLGILAQAGERGAELVYRYGVGVEAASTKMDGSVHDHGAYGSSPVEPDPHAETDHHQ